MENENEHSASPTKPTKVDIRHQDMTGILEAIRKTHGPKFAQGVQFASGVMTMFGCVADMLGNDITRGNMEEREGDAIMEVMRHVATELSQMMFDTLNITNQADDVLATAIEIRDRARSMNTEQGA